jgi:hypothetical protein
MGGAIMVAVGLWSGCGEAPCNQVQLPPSSVTVEAGTGSPPVAVGGDIVDGTYVLTSMLDYNVGDGLIGQGTLGVIELSGGTISSASISAKGAEVRTAASYTVSGSTLVQRGTCGFGDTLSQGFTATPTTITTIQSSPDFVSFFTRM